MSIASEVTALNTNLTAAKNAVTAKGGTVGDTGLAGLATEIESIPSGGDDDPGNYGIVWYYENIETDIDNIDANNCSAEITDETAFTKAILNSRRGSSAFDNLMLDIMYQQGSGWLCFDISDDPMTTEDLETKLGITVTNFDPETADYASIMIMGKLSIDKTQKPTKYKLQSLEEYNRLADPEATGGQWEVLVPLATIWKFMFGRAVTEMPDGFLTEVPNLEYLDTTYADGIITIGSGVLNTGRIGVRNDIEFKNATSIGFGCFGNGVCKGAMSFPNVISVGDSCFGGVSTQPSLPKVETIGNSFMVSCNASAVNMETMPALRTIGNSAFYQGQIEYFSMDLRFNKMPNLQSIGTGFLWRMYKLDTVQLSEGVESLNIDSNSFTLVNTEVTTYVAGIRLRWYGDSTKKQQFLNAHPNSSTNQIYRKWR